MDLSARPSPRPCHAARRGTRPGLPASTLPLRALHRQETHAGRCWHSWRTRLRSPILRFTRLYEAFSRQCAAGTDDRCPARSVFSGCGPAGKEHHRCGDNAGCSDAPRKFHQQFTPIQDRVIIPIHWVCSNRLAAESIRQLLPPPLSGASGLVWVLIPRARRLARGFIPPPLSGASGLVWVLIPRARGLARGFIPSPLSGAFR